MGLEEEGQENGFVPLSDIAGEYKNSVHHNFYLLFTEYDDNNAAADGYYDNNVDEQYIDAAISSHDPTAEYQSQISMLSRKVI